MNAERLSPSKLKKSAVLGKLEEERELTPNIPVRRHLHLGYSYARPAGEANITMQKLTQWAVDCGVVDMIEFENILAIFKQEGLISSFLFSQQEEMLKLTFPDDFEKLVITYREKMFGSSKTKSGTGLAKIHYDATTGRGTVNGKNFQFKDGSSEYFLFRQLYSRITRKIPRDEVLVLLGFYKDDEEPNQARKPAETEEINKVVKSIRKKTNLNTNQLVINNGNLTLQGQKTSQT